MARAVAAEKPNSKVAGVHIGINAPYSFGNAAMSADDILKMTEADLVLSLLSMVDLALVGSLIVMVMFSGYENFVSRIDAEGTDSLGWLGKLDAGTQAWMERVNRPTVLLDQVLANILALARQRPVVIQSLFPAIHGQEPPEPESREHAQRLKELKDAGADIPLVQVYSATRPTPHSECGHLPLRSLARIAQVVRDTTGLRAEVF